MKPWILLALAVASPPALAASEAICEGHATFAREVMASRQAGIPITDVIALVKKEGSYTQLQQQIILQAYESPRFNTPAHREREATEYQNTVYVQCMRQTGKP